MPRYWLPLTLVWLSSDFMGCASAMWSSTKLTSAFSNAQAAFSASSPLTVSVILSLSCIFSPINATRLLTSALLLFLYIIAVASNDFKVCASNAAGRACKPCGFLMIIVRVTKIWSCVFNAGLLLLLCAVLSKVMTGVCAEHLPFIFNKRSSSW